MAGLVGWARGEAVALARPVRRPRPARRARPVRRRAGQPASRACAGRSSTTTSPPSVDIATALFHLWTVRGLHLEVLGWARGLLHVDDPQRRRRSAILRGRASGRPLPDADRLAWTCVLISVNAGISGRPAARRARPAGAADAARRAARRGVAAADRARGGVARASTSPTWTTSLQSADRADRAPGPVRAGVRPDRARGGTGERRPARGVDRRRRAGVPPVRDRPATTGAWRWPRRRRRAVVLPPGGERRAGRVAGAQRPPHGAGRRHRRTRASIRVLLDVQLALAGDADAERRLRRDGDPGPGRADGRRAGPPRPGAPRLAARALRRGARPRRRGDPCPRRLDRPAAAAACDAPGRGGGPAPAGRRRAAGCPATTPPPRRPRCWRSPATTRCRSRDLPVIGAWALGGAELAAYRGDIDAARELCALGERLGTQHGAVLPDRGAANGSTPPSVTRSSGESLLAAWRAAAGGRGRHPHPRADGRTCSAS